MRREVDDAARRDVAASAAREAAEAANLDPSVLLAADADAGADDPLNPNLHCYVCKQRGHTKKDCPVRRCKFCGEPGHPQKECDKFKAHLAEEAAAEKARKRAAQYAGKKAKRKEEWEAHLRAQTGIEGFEVLYRILDLPPRRLATKAQITKQYHRLSLKVHPDKTGHLPEEEREKAAEKFLSVKTAYDLLCEGMENGGKGFGGPVFSAGEIESRFASSTGMALSRAALGDGDDDGGRGA